MLTETAALSTLPSQASAFAAPLAPTVRFLPQSAVGEVAGDYHNDKLRWRLRHLPLVVGTLEPEALPQLSGAPGSKEIFLIAALRTPEFSDCAQRLTRRVSKLGDKVLKTEIAQEKLVDAWASLASQVLAFDRQWFGKPDYSYLLLHRETIVPPDPAAPGHGRFIRSGAWHRDGTTSRQGDRARIYVMRSSHPMRMLPNALTEGLPNNRKGDMQGEAFLRLAAERSRSPQAGEVVLMNGGSRTGTAHASMRPQPWQGGQSCFLALTCYAPSR